MRPPHVPFTGNCAKKSRSEVRIFREGEDGGNILYASRVVRCFASSPQGG